MGEIEEEDEDLDLDLDLFDFLDFFLHCFFDLFLVGIFTGAAAKGTEPKVPPKGFGDPRTPEEIRGTRGLEAS